MVLLLIGAVTLMLLATVAAGCMIAIAGNDRRLRRRFLALVTLGAAAGVWCTFFCHYQPSPNWQVFGFPVPVALWHWERGTWVDYVGGPGWIIDLIAVPALIALPATVPMLLHEWRGARTARLQSQRRCVACGYDLRMSEDRCPECGREIQVGAMEP